MDFNSSTPFPEGVISFLDTDLYKLTMQCAVFKYYRDIPVTYAFTNRTPDKKLSRKAFAWLSEQISKLGNISLSDEEYNFLKDHCKYLSQAYLDFLREFRLSPRDQINATFKADQDTGSDNDLGEIDLRIAGKWVDTILYEIPLLALTSEAYFRFMDTDWSYDGQQERAKEKGLELMAAGCIVSEFGTRRRRDYHTQAIVIRGLMEATKELPNYLEKLRAEGKPVHDVGKISGTSNVHLAMRFKIEPVGTVAHEWFMGVAAITNDYRNANEEALRRWVGCFGEGVLGIALTDTFGTDAFLEAFKKPVRYLPDTPGVSSEAEGTTSDKTYAGIFAGVRQDSGDPEEFVKWIRDFYQKEKVKGQKTIVFSDSLDKDKCIKYKKTSEAGELFPTFGVGTWLSNDFYSLKTGKKSVPLNIVIKLSSADGNPAIKLSDNVGKNMGPTEKIAEVKKLLAYKEKDWEGGDETRRWGGEK